MIICAALKINGTDTVIGCFRHGDGYSALHELRKDIYPAHPDSRTVTEGFLCSDGKFVDRKEAYRIALECGQLNLTTRNEKKKMCENELYSEDLY